MSESIYVALIAFSGVVFSAIISYVVSKRQSELQMKNMLHEYSEVLFLQRLEAYPKMYSILSSFAKSANRQELTYLKIQETIEQLDDWDSHYILIVGQKTVVPIINFENYLKKLSALSEDELNTDDIKKQAIKSVIEIEQILKLELGVYSITEFQNASLDLQKLFNEQQNT